MARNNQIIAAWLRKATPEQAKELARLAKTSVPHLRHIAKGRRGISAELAQRLAGASVSFLDDFDGKLRLKQTELCVACGKCPLV
jgi:transcriptional regulator with XRE-family HTH domain